MILTPGTEELITLVIALIVGIIGMKPFNWLKEQFGLEDQMALLFVYLMSAAVGIVGLLISGQLLGMEFSLNNFMAIAGVISLAAKYAYERMKVKNV